MCLETAYSIRKPPAMAALFRSEDTMDSIYSNAGLTMAFIFGCLVGVCFMSYLWSKMDECFAPLSIVPKPDPVKIIYRACAHPFAQCACGELFFLLYADLMFAPERCPSCAADRATFTTIEQSYWQGSWRPKQKKELIEGMVLPLSRNGELVQVKLTT